MLLLLQTHKFKLFMMTLHMAWHCGLSGVLLHLLSLIRLPWGRRAGRADAAIPNSPIGGQLPRLPRWTAVGGASHSFLVWTGLCVGWGICAAAPQHNDLGGTAHLQPCLKGEFIFSLMFLGPGCTI